MFGRAALILLGWILNFLYEIMIVLGWILYSGHEEYCARIYARGMDRKLNLGFVAGGRNEQEFFGGVFPPFPIQREGLLPGRGRGVPLRPLVPLTPIVPLKKTKNKHECIVVRWHKWHKEKEPSQKQQLTSSS